MPALAAVVAVVLAVAAVGLLVFLRAAAPTNGTPGAKASPVATATPSASAAATPSTVAGVLTPPKSPIALPAQATLSAPSKNVVWALIEADALYLYESTDAGQTWQQRPLPPSLGIVEISFVGDSEGFIASLASPETQCNAQGVQIWHTTDAGATWTALGAAGIADGQCKTGLSFTDSLHGFIGAYDQNGRAVIYHTSDGGGTWTPSTRLADPPGFKSEPGGWYLQAGPVRKFGGLLLVAVTQSNPAARHVYMSRDGGATWQYDVTTQLFDGSLAFITATHWLQLIVPGQSMETTDGGHTWHASSSDYSQAAPVAPEVVFADDQVGYATVRGGIQLTTDGGRHWTEIKTPGT